MNVTKLVQDTKHSNVFLISFFYRTKDLKEKIFNFKQKYIFVDNANVDCQRKINYVTKWNHVVGYCLANDKVFWHTPFFYNLLPKATHIYMLHILQNIMLLFIHLSAL